MSAPNSLIELLNWRLGMALGMANGGTVPRFAWKYAPDQFRFIYDTDDQTIVRKRWADQPSPDGQPYGRVWLLGQWCESVAVDNMGFLPVCEACSGSGMSDPYCVGRMSVCVQCKGRGRVAGIRMARTHDAMYQPHFETALARGAMPSEERTAHLIADISRQMAMSAQFNPRSLDLHLMDEKYSADRNERRQREDWRESAMADYDQHVGAFGNCSPGTAGGYMSLAPRPSVGAGFAGI